MQDGLQVKGTVKIYNKDKTVLLNEYHNAFLNNGKQAIFSFLKGDYAVEGYKYLSIGIGNAPTDPAMTQLVNEVFRKELSNISIVDNKLVLDCLIENNEANIGEPWAELGLVIGGTSSQLNSGLLFNRVNIFEKKDTSSAITVSWEIQIIST